jgi:hypothetical protein
MVSVTTRPFDTERYRMDVDVANLLSGILRRFAEIGSDAAPPLTRREHLWWARQYLKRRDFEFAWGHFRRAISPLI